MKQLTNDQYYTREPSSESRPIPCDFSYRGHELHFMTDHGVFSKGELDFGTKLLLQALPPLHGQVLDLGSGWGAIGVSLAKANNDCFVTMADVNLRALSLCKQNAERNGVQVECIESDGLSVLMNRTFNAIVTNPPIRAGKQVIYQMFADAAKVLENDGALYLVIRKQQGAQSCVKYLNTLYTEVEKLEKSGGFWVLKASKPRG